MEGWQIGWALGPTLKDLPQLGEVVFDELSVLLELVIGCIRSPVQGEDEFTSIVISNHPQRVVGHRSIREYYVMIKDAKVSSP